MSDSAVRNLADTVRRAASTAPTGAALIGSDEAGTRTVTTWADVDAQVDAVAAGLLALNLPAVGATPARVAIALPNVLEFATVLFGTLRAGLVAVPLNPGYTPRELRHALSDAGTSVVITTAPVSAAVTTIRDEVPTLRHLYVVGSEPFRELTAPSGPVHTATGDEDLAVLLYTSGTAGVPKGAMLSHRALLANNRQVAAVDPPIVRPGDIVLLALPLFHAFGLNSGLGAIAWHAATGVLVDQFDPAGCVQTIAREHISVVTAVPPMYAAFAEVPDVREHLRSVRLAISGAATLNRSVAERFAATTGQNIVEGYGLTETAPVLATALASPVPKPGSIGRPIPEVEIKLVAADGSEIARVGPGGLLDELPDDFDDDAGGVPGTDPGEIVARGPNLFSGYWPDRAGGPDPDGWWGTGDVAYADPDGDLFLVDRLGELIIVSGFNVYPHEVELVLAGHPAVREAAVVPIEDPRTGQAVKAYVVVSGDVSVAELAGHCERNLARFKCPTVIEVVPELPRSATGKVRKGVLDG